MQIVLIIQARMSSTRLPGKVLLPINGEALLWYVVNRIKCTKHIDQVVIATSTNASDDKLYIYCQKQQYTVFRGKLDDVLSRYYETAKEFKADTVIRITSDCPLIDGDLISQGLEQYLEENSDYLSNTIKRTFPRGFDFEIFTFKALETAYKNAHDTVEREHVTPYIYRTHRQEFKISQFVQRIDKSAYQLSVDTQEDYQLIKILIENYHADSLNCQQIISLLDSHPELPAINNHIPRKHFGQ